MAQLYSFPILDDSELLACVREMALPLSAATLAKPTPEIVKLVYENLIEALMGISREEQLQPVFVATSALQYPELHDESIPFMSLLRTCSKLLAAAGVRDFSAQDIYKPDPARLRRHLSGIINFAKFREERLGQYTELQIECDDLLEEGQKLEEANNALAEEINRLQEERNTQEPEAAAIRAETQALHAEIKALSHQLTSLRAEDGALKQQVVKLMDEAAQESVKLDTAEHEAAALRELIVESPEKLRARMEETAAALERERGLVAEAERRLRELQARLDIISKVDKDVKKMTQLMAEVGDEIAHKKENSKRVKGLSQQLAAAAREEHEYTVRKEHLTSKRRFLQERIQSTQETLKSNLEAAESAIVEQQKDMLAVEAENAANNAKLMENIAHERQLRSTMADMQNAHTAQMNAVMEKYESLKSQFKEYHDELRQAMNTSAATSAMKAVRIR